MVGGPARQPRLALDVASFPPCDGARLVTLARRTVVPHDHRWRGWRYELRLAERKPRVLEHGGYGFEDCVICSTETDLWLQPENAPLCSDGCKAKYLHNPRVYDPRGLYGDPTT